jgi:hypothetical protein
MPHPIRVQIRTDMIATKIRVGIFEILKQKSNSAMKNITILSPKTNFINMNRVQRLETQKMTYDHMSNAQGRLKIMAIGSRPKIL